MSKPTLSRQSTLEQLVNHLASIYTQKFMLLSNVKTLEEHIRSLWPALDETERRDLLDRVEPVRELYEKLVSK